MDDEGFLRGIEGYLSTRFEAAVTVERLQRPTATGFSAETVLLDVDGLADVSSAWWFRLRRKVRRCSLTTIWSGRFGCSGSIG